MLPGIKIKQTRLHSLIADEMVYDDAGPFIPVAFAEYFL